MSRLTLPLSTLLIAALPASLFAAPSFNITRIGFTGPGYTLPDGTSNATPVALNAANQAIGFSLRYSGTTYLGQDAWLYDATANTNFQMGLLGGIYTDAATFRSSSPLLLNATGQAVGTSARFTVAGANLGESAWFYDHTTTQMGLTSAPYTSADGTQDSSPLQLSSTQYAAGNSTLYTAAEPTGTTAWVYDRTANSTTAIGFTDAAHTATSGQQISLALRATTTGTFRIVGTSDRFVGNNDAGSSAWLYTVGTGITPIGILDTATYPSNAPAGISNSGIVIGTATRADNNSTAWRYTIATATLETLGLTTAPHLSPTGETSSTPVDLNEAGDVIGTTVQFVGGSPLGQSAWVQYHGQATAVQTGFTTGAFQSVSGVHDSMPEKISANGIAAGTSEIFSGNANNGQAVWVYNPSGAGTTTRAGLFGAAFTDGSGFQFSDLQAMNATGQLIGFSTDNSANSIGWFFDPTTAATTPLSTDPTVTDTPLLLGDEGVVLGTYSSNTVTDDAFYWTLAGGFVDLGSLVNGGLAANGWQSLMDEAARNGAGSILGTGLATGEPDGGSAAYLLTIPSVPEPASLCLLMCGGLMLLRRRRGVQVSC